MCSLVLKFPQDWKSGPERVQGAEHRPNKQGDLGWVPEHHRVPPSTEPEQHMASVYPIGSPQLTWPGLSSQKLLFAGSRSQLVQVPLADCTKYRFCADCVLARDPYCAWNVNTSRCVAVGGPPG